MRAYSALAVVSGISMLVGCAANAPQPRSPAQNAVEGADVVSAPDADAAAFDAPAEAAASEADGSMDHDAGAVADGDAPDDAAMDDDPNRPLVPGMTLPSGEWAPSAFQYNDTDASALDDADCRPMRFGARGPRGVRCTEVDDVAVHYSIEYSTLLVIEAGKLRVVWSGATGVGPMYDHGSPSMGIQFRFGPDGSTMTATMTPGGACANARRWVQAHQGRSAWSEWDFPMITRYHDAICGVPGQYALTNGQYARVP